MTPLDKKLLDTFPSMAVRKDLTKLLKGSAIVPSYVLEYLLGQYCATGDEATINEGIESVKSILQKHFVHREEAGFIKSQTKEKGRFKVIDRVEVTLNDKTDAYEASFSNLGLKNARISGDYPNKYKKLLIGGVWCITDITYQFSEEANHIPWSIDTLKPIQLSNFSYDDYLEKRKQMTTDEWLDILMQTIGFNPDMLSKRKKLLQLVRLIPFGERNYNMIELGPKGTGKSHIFSEFSPHGILVSGGDVTQAKLFVNNSTGKIGLVGYWDTVAFDEFASKDKKPDKNLVDIMKNYMANKSFSRGRESMGAEASMAFIGNTKKSVAYMLKHSDLFDELPDKYYDSAFLDRLHFYIPGWEIDILRGELFTDGYGFIVDFFAEVLKTQRDYDYSNKYMEHFQLSSDIATRDRDAIHKTMSGLIKLIYPNLDYTKEEMKELLEFAMEGRKRIKDQLLKIDETYKQVDFSYTDLETKEIKKVRTLEEIEHPSIYYQDRNNEPEGDTQVESISEPPVENQSPKPALESGKHITIHENQKGISYEKLFADYLVGAKSIEITDPYIRAFHQVKHLMEFLQLVRRLQPEGEDVEVFLNTSFEKGREEESERFLEQIVENTLGTSVNFSYNFDASIHARHIVTDTGWKISLDRGLDIFQPYDIKNQLSLEATVQEERACRAFEVTYLKVDD